MLEFDDDDNVYRQWLAQNPDGFVINTTRNKSANYMILHRASCRTISKYTDMAQPGGFTERDYIKVCAPDLVSLRVWVRQHGRPDSSFTGVCSICNPA